MAEKFQNKYRIQSARLPKWDYRWNAAYFVTICTKDRKYFFGDVVNGEMQLSQTGVIADIFWNGIKNHTNNIELGAYIIMPNHVHGIVIINNSVLKMNDVANDWDTVETLHATSLRCNPKPSMSNISPNAGSLSTIIRSYKSAVTKHANRLGFKNGWQTRFHDHIIRDDDEYKRIEDYILANPQKWDTDRFYS